MVAVQRSFNKVALHLATMLNSMTPAQIRAFMGHTTGGDKGGGGNGGGGGKKGGVGKSGGGGKGRLQCHR
ncbi:hypothetical protein G6O67_006693 [Ophiocordyceps sinensis]|uniref:Uncharacterized protein n=1 Tax=Ophiocordyceps sinensis TaxID=72228 RepID=A0A8H4LX98_9HYPO|nr:hypothetical protein G6O67_006693 [Ophiocordyceps sinensis]